MQPRIRSVVIASACVSLGLLNTAEGFAQERVNCPLWRMMDMGTRSMFMSNEYTRMGMQCIDGPFLSSWYGVLPDSELPKVCPDCDPIAAPASGDSAIPIPERPPAREVRTALHAKVHTGESFPGYGGGKKTSAFRPHEQPVGNGGFPEFSSDKLKPKPLETPPRFVRFEWQNETYFAILLDYEVKPRKACKHSPNCQKLPKRQNICIGYEIQYTDQHSFPEIEIDPDWDPQPPQPKMVRVLESNGNACIVLLAADQNELTPLPEAAPTPAADQYDTVPRRSR